MSLVIKPTELCNFSCTFCSSSELVEDPKSRLELEKIYQFLKRFPATTKIFVVGGDPLMMTPAYYKELLNHIEEYNYPAIVSITSNLWAFFTNPEKWKWFLNHPKVEVGTSFQYGEGRQIKPGQVFTEGHFIEVYNLFKQEVPNKELCFLAVVNEENEHLALDHVYLAKKLGTQCRLVYANMSGRSGKPYPLSKLYKIFLEIHDLGLAEYEQTALTISDKILGIEVACPLSRNCDQNMRSINADGRYFSCGPLNDDLDTTNEISWEDEIIEGKGLYLPIQSQKENQYLKEECFSCKMFQVCNACRKHIKDLKQADMVEEHCTTMKGIMNRLEDMSTDDNMTKLRLGFTPT